MHTNGIILGDVTLRHLFYEESSGKVINTSWTYLKSGFEEEITARSFPAVYWKQLDRRQSHEPEALDIYALLWAYTDIVAMRNKQRTIPSRRFATLFIEQG